MGNDQKKCKALLKDVPKYLHLDGWINNTHKPSLTPMIKIKAD